MGPQAGLSNVRKAIVTSAGEALGTKLVALFMIDPSSGGIECEAHPEVDEALQAAFFDTCGALITDRDQQDPRVFETDLGDDPEDQARQVFIDRDIRCVAVCPIRSEAGVTGALAAFYTTCNAVSKPRIDVIKAIAAQASAAISYTLEIEQARSLLDDLAGANQELSVQATSDGLTGLANHRTLQQTIAELCRGGGRGRRSNVFSLVMVDVDNFKLYNDTYGHQEGDAVLRKVAKVLASKLRQGDLAGRYGGEEFALVLRGTGKEDALAVADRTRQCVAEQQYSQGSISVSMGVAEFPADGSTPGELIERADRALYHAKVTGRNRVVVWGSAGCTLAEEDPDSPANITQHRTILVVEKSDENCAGVVVDALSSSACTVEVTNGTTEAMELLRMRAFDIALVSLETLPDRDIKALGTLSAIHPHMPIVFVGEQLALEEGREALRRGASDILLKPYNIAELPLVIERNIERRRIERQKLSQKNASMMLQVIEAAVAIIDARDHHTAGHSRRVTALSLAIADELDLSSEEIHALDLAAMLHDIGKLALPDSAFNKQSPLTEEEWHVMREHTALGGKIIGVIDEMSYVSTIIRHHHERLDGTGYPDGLRGPAIPYPARIIAVADAYEAMTSMRAHRSRLTPKEAMEELRRHSGTYYDPEIVAALEKQLVASGEMFRSQSEQAA